MKFSIRDLLLVTVIVALTVGWWVDRSRLAEEVQDWTRSAWEIATKYEVETGRELGLTPDGRPWPPLPNSSAPAPNPPKPKP